MLDEQGLMKRPSFQDDYVKRRAAELALPQIKAWAWGDRSFDNDAEVMSDLMRGLSARSDGYELAKTFEALGWSVNAELVDVLGTDFVSDARTEMVTKWVRCLGISLTLPIGTAVVYRGKPATITRLMPETAEYGLHSADLSENAWIVVNAEDLAAQQVLPGELKVSRGTFCSTPD